MKRRLFLAILGALLLLVVFSYGWVPLRTSQDDWWHLKTGAWIVEHGSLPVYDIFTYTGADTVWYNHEWLSQVIFWLIYEHCGGLFGLLTFKAFWVALTFAGVAWLSWRRCGVWVVALVVAWLAAEISRRGIYVRPPLFSYALFALYLGLFDAWKRSRLSGWVLAAVTVPLMILWANLHGMYLLGIVVCGAYCCGEFVEWCSRRRKGETLPLRRVLFLCGLGVGFVLAACVNPYGWKLFFLGSKFMNDPYLSKVISEMQVSPFFLVKTSAGWSFIPGFFACWFTAALFVALLLWKRRLPSVADLLLSLFFLYQGLMHWRLLVLFGIAISGPLSWLIVQSLPRSESGRRRVLGAIGVVGGVLAMSMMTLVGEPPPQTFLRRNILLSRGETMDAASYPEAVVRFIERADLPDNMFSPLNYCGYFMWRLAPEKHKLFTDNRFDIWGSKWWLEHEVILSASEKSENVLGKSWHELLDEHGVNFLVLNRDSQLHERLAADASHGGSDWAHIYYWIPPGEPVAGHGFSIWLRSNGIVDRSAVVAKSLELFREENPGRPLPSVVE